MSDDVTNEENNLNNLELEISNNSSAASSHLENTIPSGSSTLLSPEPKRFKMSTIMRVGKPGIVAPLILPHSEHHLSESVSESENEFELDLQLNLNLLSIENQQNSMPKKLYNISRISNIDENNDLKGLEVPSKCQEIEKPCDVNTFFVDNIEQCTLDCSNYGFSKLTPRSVEIPAKKKCERDSPVLNLETNNVLDINEINNPTLTSSSLNEIDGEILDLVSVDQAINPLVKSVSNYTTYAQNRIPDVDLQTKRNIILVGVSDENINKKPPPFDKNASNLFTQATVLPEISHHLDEMYSRVKPFHVTKELLAEMHKNDVSETPNQSEALTNFYARINDTVKPKTNEDDIGNISLKMISHPDKNTQNVQESFSNESEDSVASKEILKAMDGIKCNNKYNNMLNKCPSIETVEATLDKIEKKSKLNKPQIRVPQKISKPIHFEEMSKEERMIELFASKHMTREEMTSDMFSTISDEQRSLTSSFTSLHQRTIDQRLTLNQSNDRNKSYKSHKINKNNTLLQTFPTQKSTENILKEIKRLVARENKETAITEDHPKSKTTTISTQSDWTIEVLPMKKTKVNVHTSVKTVEPKNSEEIVLKRHSSIKEEYAPLVTSDLIHKTTKDMSSPDLVEYLIGNKHTTAADKYFHLKNLNTVKTKRTLMPNKLGNIKEENEERRSHSSSKSMIPRKSKENLIKIHHPSSASIRSSPTTDEMVLLQNLNATDPIKVILPPIKSFSLLNASIHNTHEINQVPYIKKNLNCDLPKNANFECHVYSASINNKLEPLAKEKISNYSKNSTKNNEDHRRSSSSSTGSKSQKGHADRNVFSKNTDNHSRTSSESASSSSSKAKSRFKKVIPRIQEENVLPIDKTGKIKYLQVDKTLEEKFMIERMKPENICFIPNPIVESEEDIETSDINNSESKKSNKPKKMYRKRPLNKLPMRAIKNKDNISTDSRSTGARSASPIKVRQRSRDVCMKPINLRRYSTTGSSKRSSMSSASPNISNRSNTTSKPKRNSSKLNKQIKPKIFYRGNPSLLQRSKSPSIKSNSYSINSKILPTKIAPLYAAPLKAKCKAIKPKLNKKLHNPYASKNLHPIRTKPPILKPPPINSKKIVSKSPKKAKNKIIVPRTRNRSLKVIGMANTKTNKAETKPLFNKLDIQGMRENKILTILKERLNAIEENSSSCESISQTSKTVVDKNIEASDDLSNESEEVFLSSHMYIDYLSCKNKPVFPSMKEKVKIENTPVMSKKDIKKTKKKEEKLKKLKAKFTKVSKDIDEENTIEIFSMTSLNAPRDDHGGGCSDVKETIGDLISTNYIDVPYEPNLVLAAQDSGGSNNRIPLEPNIIIIDNKSNISSPRSERSILKKYCESSELNDDKIYTSNYIVSPCTTSPQTSCKSSPTIKRNMRKYLTKHLNTPITKQRSRESDLAYIPDEKEVKITNYSDFNLPLSEFSHLPDNKSTKSIVTHLAEQVFKSNGDQETDEDIPADFRTKIITEHISFRELADNSRKSMIELKESIRLNESPGVSSKDKLGRRKQILDVNYYLLNDDDANNVDRKSIMKRQSGELKRFDDSVIAKGDDNWCDLDDSDEEATTRGCSRLWTCFELFFPQRDPNFF